MKVRSPQRHRPSATGAAQEPQPRKGSVSAWQRRLEGSPRLAWVLKWFSRFAYAGALLVLAGLVAYFSFSTFVRSGVTSVPDLLGLDEVEAAQRLADRGLELRIAMDQGAYDDAVEAGRILKQRPAPQALVKRGTEVVAAPSLGPQIIEVPDLNGQSAQEVQVTLAAAGLTLGRSLQVVDARAMAGTVVEQLPAAGDGVAPATAVDVLVSRSSRVDQYVMPDLVYRRYRDSKRFFEQRGFRLGNVKYEVYEGIPEGVILRQFPLAGHPLRREDAISLVVSTSAASSIPEP
ncbi:MAG: PASTA domain-containing protein [Acidobacteriota bacterium]